MHVLIAETKVRAPIMCKAGSTLPFCGSIQEPKNGSVAPACKNPLRTELLWILDSPASCTGNLIIQLYSMI